MTETAVARYEPAMIEQVAVGGDLSQLTPQQRVDYYGNVCNSMGLNPLTKPFAYLKLNNKLVLYVLKDCTEQLRKIHDVSLRITSREKIDTVYVVTASATLPSGRVDESTGVVSLGNLKGDVLANAMMKAETKAKRRVTLSIVGLGWLDESEVETVPAAHIVEVADDGEIVAGNGEPEPTGNDDPAHMDKMDDKPTIKTDRPAPAESVRNMLHNLATGKFAKYVGQETSAAHKGFLNGKMNEAGQGDDNRHLFLEYISGDESSGGLDKSLWLAIGKWLTADEKDSSGETPFNEYAVSEFMNCVRAAQADAGQTEFTLPEQNEDGSLQD